MLNVNLHVKGLRAAAKATRELPEGFDACDGYFGGDREPSNFCTELPFFGPCEGG